MSRVWPGVYSVWTCQQTYIKNAHLEVCVHWMWKAFTDSSWLQTAFSTALSWLDLILSTGEWRRPPGSGACYCWIGLHIYRWLSIVAEKFFVDCVCVVHHSWLLNDIVVTRLGSFMFAMINFVHSCCVICGVEYLNTLNTCVPLQT